MVIYMYKKITLFHFSREILHEDERLLKFISNYSVAACDNQNHGLFQSSPDQVFGADDR